MAGASVRAGAPFPFVVEKHFPDLTVAALLYFGLGAVFFCYSAAFGFGLSFDDNWNLAGLAGVLDARSAMEFVAGGAAGPLGRPLALLSFVPHAASWPSAPQDFLYENALIHILNTLLLFWLTYRLVDHFPWRVASPAWMCLFAALWWSASPLLFSTSAMIVQRMTSLSLLFCLLGSLSYVIGWQLLREGTRTGFVLMAWGAGGCTLLAALSKENGALLPGLILLIDRVVLAHSPNNQLRLSAAAARLYQSFRIIFLWLPTCAVIGYLALGVPDFLSGYRTRDFTLNERLLTESRILIDYVRLLVLPVRSGLGPFHDDYTISTSLLNPPSTLLAVFTLLAATFIAWKVRRSRWRLFTVAWVWFLWGQITESTVVPLELYFEHRNYLSSIGVAIALAGLIFHPQVATWARFALTGLLLGTSLFVLHETALLWGDRPVAAASWYQSHPQSLRALQFRLVTLQEQNRIDEYLNTVDHVQAPLRDSAEYTMIRVAAACNFRDATAVNEAANDAIVRLRTTSYSPVTTELLDTFADTFEEQLCAGLSRDHIRGMVAAIIANPDDHIRDDMRAQAHEIDARLAIADRDFSATLSHLEESFRLRPTLDVGITLVGMLTSAGLYDEASRKLDEVETHQSRRLIVRDRWQAEIKEMREIVRKARQETQEGMASQRAAS
jgi:hypothetical protein